MSLVWPVTLPTVPLREGNSEGFGEARLRTQMDAGPAKVRRRFTAAPKSLQIAFLFTDDELDDFLDFWESDTANGTLSFEFDHPRTGDTVTARFDATVPKWVQVDDAPGGGRQWQVAISLEILP